MPYSKQTWNDDDSNTPVNAARLSHIEDGIEAAAGTSAGSPIIRKFPFAYNTPNLLTGASLYTPTIGDILLDLWVEITTAWNGVTPQGEVGTFIAQNTGIYSNLTSNISVLDMTFTDFDTELFRMGGQNSLLSNVAAMEAVQTTMQVDGLAINFKAGPRSLNSGNRFMGSIYRDDPIKVCVSQDGTNTGADPGSTQGAAVLYLVTATPV